MRCLRCLVHVRWQEKKSNTEVLQICNITGIEAFLITAQLRWTGHVLCMGDNRLPKAIFCSELEECTRSHGGQRKRYKDTLKANLKRCHIAPLKLEELVLDWSDWRSHCKTSVQPFEAGRVWTLETKQEQRKLLVYRKSEGNVMLSEIHLSIRPSVDTFVYSSVDLFVQVNPFVQ